MFLKEYLDKLYIFIEEAKQDNMISLEEIKKFQSIIDEFNGEIKAIKFQKTDDIKISINELMKIISEGLSQASQSKISNK